MQCNHPDSLFTALIRFMFLSIYDCVVRISRQGGSHRGRYSLIGHSLGSQSSKWLFTNRERGTFSSLVVVSPGRKSHELLVLSQGGSVCFSSISLPRAHFHPFSGRNTGTINNHRSGHGNISLYGLPATSNLFTLNGMNDMDPLFNLNNSGPTNLMLGQNDVREATVVTNGYSGEYGGLAGANINYVRKSGTNAFHGNGIITGTAGHSTPTVSLTMPPILPALLSTPINGLPRWAARLSRTRPSFLWTRKEYGC